ncbi:B5 [Micractinium conductrix]|uniref:B5 n=1 Tax=Micractinium conductrix TaxID=554055 RepID=A0A2P6VLE4_9CHLO|nr:B5 [Micractinium conductrix]|eukprot:PSC74877.1 B5 [Micractinium conductrix]
MAEVATHNAADDCWIVISGKVYDITGWLPYHPGGEMPLLAQCSRDATAAFNMQHSEDLEPQERLPTYYVGDLVMP